MAIACLIAKSCIFNTQPVSPAPCNDLIYSLFCITLFHIVSTAAYNCLICKQCRFICSMLFHMFHIFMKQLPNCVFLEKVDTLGE